MGTFAPQSVYSNTPSPQTGAGLAALASNLEAVKELPGAQPPQNIEISDNALTFSATPVSAFLIVDTEGQAAADDLEVINPVVSATDNLHDGMLLYLQAADTGRVVTVKNSSSANGIRTAGGGDITLVTDAWLVLQLRSGTWYELAVQPSGVLPIANGGTGSNTKNFVDLSSAQTVGGIKTLTSNLIVKNSGPSILCQQTDITKGTHPASNQFSQVSFTDSQGTGTANRIAALQAGLLTNGSTYLGMYAYKNENASTANSQIGIYMQEDGTAYTLAPTPAAGDNSTKIATTAWFKNEKATTTNFGVGRSATDAEATAGATSGTGPAWVTPKQLFSRSVIYVTQMVQSGASWYRIWSNKFCEQYLHLSTSATFTFLKPYANTNYAVLAYSQYNVNGYQHALTLSAKTTTYLTFEISNDIRAVFLMGFIS